MGGGGGGGGLKVDFANPGILGTPHEFHKKVAAPILAGREPDATKQQIERANQ